MKQQTFNIIVLRTPIIFLYAFRSRCKILDMKKNRLQDCPDRVGTLSRLKRLELDGEIRRRGQAAYRPKYSTR